MATPIATGALKPRVAVAIAAVLNLVGAFLSTEVAKTVSGGIIREGDGGVQITPTMIFAGLMGAIVWNLVTWLRGLPSSSSHALFGGLIGAAVVGAGLGSVDFGVVLSKVILPALLAPAIAGLIAYTTTKLAYSITRRSSGPNERGGFRYGQIFTSSLVALAHGTNDAQKTMGIITLTLIAGGFQAAGSGPAFWVIAVCAVAIALGTYMGGWRIIRTMGSGLTEVKPAQGFSAEASTAATILASSHLGFALSTTQVASGSVIGSGLGRRGACALEHGGQDRARLAADAAVGRHRGRGRGVHREHRHGRLRHRRGRRRRGHRLDLLALAPERGRRPQRHRRGRRRRIRGARTQGHQGRPEGQGGRMIDWSAFLVVAVAALVGAVAVVCLFSLGVRLLAVGTEYDDEGDKVSVTGIRPQAATVGGYVCFALSGLAVLYGVYLIVPALHS